MSEEPDQTPQGARSRQSEQTDPAPPPPPSPGEVLEIKKYPNRRLYDTTRSRHVTLDELYELVAAGHAVRVLDSRTGEDLTNQVLLQALIERDPLKVNAVPTALIHLMIRMNAHLIASCFDLGLSQILEAYRAAAAAGGALPAAPGATGVPWWPAGWPALPGMHWPGTFPPRSSANAAGVPISPFAWMESFMPGGVRSAGGSGGPVRPPKATREPPPEPAEPGEAVDLDELRSQVAALAAELERLKSSGREEP